MILGLGIVAFAGMLPATCQCCDSPPACQSVVQEGPHESCPILALWPPVKRPLFRRSGWRRGVLYDINNHVVPPMHISLVELGPTSGWISRRGRKGHWQLDAWQVTSVSPLQLGPDAHVHLEYRFLHRRRQAPSSPRSLGWP